MNKSITRAAAALLVCTSLNAAAVTPGTSASSGADLAREALGKLPASNYELLSQASLEASHGRMLPLLPAIAAIATIDLGISAFFWGIYVPYYGAGTGECFACGESGDQKH